VPSSQGSRARAALHRRQVHAGIEQVARERSPAVMGREGCDARALRHVTQPVVHRLLGETPRQDAPVAVDRHEQRAGLASAHPQPRAQCIPRPVGEEHGTFLVALPDDAQPARLTIVVGKIERDQFGASGAEAS
jgi:hypothetical protein